MRLYDYGPSQNCFKMRVLAAHLGMALEVVPVSIFKGESASLRQLLRLFQVVDLGRQIVPPQRDAEQELHPGHDPVAIADAEAALDQVQLKAANVVGGGSVGRFASRTRGPANIRLCARSGHLHRNKAQLEEPRRAW